MDHPCNRSVLVDLDAKLNSYMRCPNYNLFLAIPHKIQWMLQLLVRPSCRSHPSKFGILHNSTRESWNNSYFTLPSDTSSGMDSSLLICLLSDQTKFYSSTATEQAYTFSAAVNHSSSASPAFTIKSLFSILMSNKPGSRSEESSNPATTFTH